MILGPTELPTYPRRYWEANTSGALQWRIQDTGRPISSYLVGVASTLLIGPKACITTSWDIEVHIHI